jgi:hypothetical protein
MDAVTEQIGHESYILPFKLTQQQAKILCLLMEVPVADAHAISRRTGMSTEAKVAVHRLRNRMKEYGVTISAKRYYGFWLEPDQKAKVKELMA